MLINSSGYKTLKVYIIHISINLSGFSFTFFVLVGSTIANAKCILQSINLSLLVIFANFPDWKSAASTLSQNGQHGEDDDSVIDLTTGGKGAAQPVQNLPQDFSFCNVEPQLEPDDETLDNSDNDSSDPLCHDFTGLGTHTYHFYNYKYRLQTLSNHLINIANVIVQMEENGAACQENMQFSDIVDECGKELITKGNMLLHLGTRIKKICDNYSGKIQPLAKKKKHEHTVVTHQPPEPSVDVVVDDNLIITQRNPDDDRNTYYNPGKYPPMTIKCEFPDCSLAEEEENSDSNDNQDDLLGMLAPSIQSMKKWSVKGLHICHLCGKDYINKSDLNSHLMAHAGVTFNCEWCGLKLPS